MKAKPRTVRQVEAERFSVTGCCDRNADQQWCDCLDRARDYERQRRAKAKTLPKPLEKETQAQILRYLQTVRRIKAWRQNQGAVKVPAQGGAKGRFFRMASAKGISDIIGLLPPHGRFLAIEVKRLGEHPTPDQQAFLDGVNAAGGLGFVARSIEDVGRELDAASKGDG
jgi:hypothetical protein